MILVHGPTGGINWAYTSKFLKNNFSDFLIWLRGDKIPDVARDEWKDFGAGNEPVFACPQCQRRLPLALAEVDHVTPKSTLTGNVDDNLLEGTGPVKVSNVYLFPRKGILNTINVNDPAPKIRGYMIKPDGSLYLRATVDPPGGRVVAPPGRRIVQAYMSTGTPLSVVVRNDVENLQLLCSYCNRAKGNR